MHSATKKSGERNRYNSLSMGDINIQEGSYVAQPATEVMAKTPAHLKGRGSHHTSRVQSTDLAAPASAASRGPAPAREHLRFAPDPPPADRATKASDRAAKASDRAAKASDRAAKASDGALDIKRVPMAAAGGGDGPGGGSGDSGDGSCAVCLEPWGSDGGSGGDGNGDGGNDERSPLACGIHTMHAWCATGVALLGLEPLGACGLCPRGTRGRPELPVGSGPQIFDDACRRFLRLRRRVEVAAPPPSAASFDTPRPLEASSRNRRPSAAVRRVSGLFGTPKALSCAPGPQPLGPWRTLDPEQQAELASVRAALAEAAAGVVEAEKPKIALRSLVKSSLRNGGHLKTSGEGGGGGGGGGGGSHGSSTPVKPAKMDIRALVDAQKMAAGSVKLATGSVRVAAGGAAAVGSAMGSAAAALNPRGLPPKVHRGEKVPGAAYVLAVMAYKGLGVTPSAFEAAKLYRDAAAGGFPLAMNNLAIMYRDGTGIEPSSADAAVWFVAAAERGLPSAQYSAGRLFHLGKGVRPNEAKAAAWYIKGAEGGDAQAQGALGNFYYQGRGGLAPSVPDALHWWGKAAAQGLGPAAVNLALAHETGVAAAHGKDGSKDGGTDARLAEAERLFAVAAVLKIPAGERGLERVRAAREAVAPWPGGGSSAPKTPQKPGRAARGAAAEAGGNESAAPVPSAPRAPRSAKRS